MVSKISFLTAALLAGAVVTGCAKQIDSGVGGGGGTTTTTGEGGSGGGAPAECGNGTAETGEECDDGNLFPGDGCSAKCAIETGFQCSGVPSVCSAICGDGFLGGGEECDDQNTSDDDGCSSSCVVEPGFQCKGVPSTCETNCGDGLVGGTEECDDHNVASGDGCNLSCQIETGYKCSGTPSACTTICGDGVVAGDEACDDGNAVGGDGCGSGCTVEDGYLCSGAPSVCTSTCGDGILAGDEACDDANGMAGDGCDFLCALEPGWTCSGAPQTCKPICGDGIVTGTEKCDDGNTVPGDGCSALCQTQYGYTCTGAPSVCKIVCGDGVLAGSEICDDGNTAAGDGCSAACKVEAGYTCIGLPSTCKAVCGNGVLSAGEQCDDNNVVPGDGCSSTCQVETGFQCAGSPSYCTTNCGDGEVGGNEQCDDGNTVSGDGCSFGCTIEGGYTCTGAAPTVCTGVCGDGLVVKGEQCDDGNSVAGDCCSAACQAETGCERELNNTSPTANDLVVVGVNGTVKGNIYPSSDVDYYAVTIPGTASSGSLLAETKDGPLAGDTCASNKLDTMITLYDVNGIPITSDDDGGAGPCSLINVPALPPGTYYLTVKNGPISTKSYSYALQVTTTLSVCGNGTKEPGEQCDDGNTAPNDGCSASCTIEGVPGEVEPNNDFAAADARAADPAPIVFNATNLLAGAIPTAGDKDVFKVDLAQAGVVRFETFDNINPGTCSLAATRIRLFNAAHTQIYTDATSGIGNCSALVLHLAAGTYYVQVEAASVAATIPGYFIEMALAADGGGEAEPNATLAQANPVTGVETFVLAGHQTASDSDYFAVTVPAGKSLRAEVIEGGAETCESLGVDSRVILYTAAGVKIGEDDDNGRGYCSLIDGTGGSPANPTAHDLTAGTYYLQVLAGVAPDNTAAAEFDYRLLVTIR